MNNFYILTHGKNGCDISSKKIHEIADVVKRYYHISAPEFWMWKMFQFGYAYGKHAERARRKKTQKNI